MKYKISTMLCKCMKKITLLYWNRYEAMTHEQLRQLHASHYISIILNFL